MSEVIKIFKRNFAFALLVLILVFILWLRGFVNSQTKTNRLDPQPAEVLTVPQTLLESTQPKENINFSLEKALIESEKLNLSSPPSLPLFVTKTSKEDPLGFAQKIASLFDFSSQPFLEASDSSKNPFFLFRKEKSSLSLGGNPLIINYSSSSSNTNSTDLVVDKQELLSKTQNLLNLLTLVPVDYSQPVFKSFQVSPDQDSETVNVDKDEESGSFTALFLTYLLDGYPVVSSDQYYPIFLLFDRWGNIIQAKIYLLESVGENGSVTISPLEKKLKETKNLRIVHLSPQNETYNENVFYNLRSVNLSSVVLVYYLPTNQIFQLKPYYSFSGTAEDDKDQVFEIKAVIEAEEEN